MKNKIKRFAAGDFHAPRPEVTFPESHIVMRVGEGEKYRGSFSLQNEGEGTIRGLVYVSSYRMKCDEEGFDGNPVNIYYTYDGTGLVPGHVEKGRFTIVCNGGEFDIDFTAIIEKPFVMTSYGKVQSLEDFKKLCFRDREEALRLFRSRDFYTILKYEDKKIRALYDNMRRWEMNRRALEEFLVGCKQKEKIFLTLDEESRSFISLIESRKDSLVVKKNTWGFQELEISARGDFLGVERPYVTTDDFTGNTYRLEYDIDLSRLHKGSNFGCITIRTPYEELSYEIIVEKDVDRDRTSADDHRELAALIRNYLKLATGVLTMEEWYPAALDRIERMRRECPKKELYLLIHANVCLLGGDKDKARDILDSYNYNRFAIGKDVELSSYYLYLTTGLSNDSIGQRRVAEELSKSYMKNPQSWKILCMLVQVDSEYKIYSERLRILESYFDEYRPASSLFYMQALACFLEKSSTLKKLGSFEVRVLHFAAKRRLISRELALYTANLASQQKVFDRMLYDTLVAIYEMFGESMVLTAICTLLIKGNQLSGEYFPWFRLAVEKELKIAQLYEYFMWTVDPESYTEALPRTVYLYFMHGNTLDHRKKAFLYANLITYEDEASEIYAHYRDEMEAFACAMIERRSINDMLRVIYKRFIREDMLTVERVRALYDICHAYEITTDVKNMSRVHVIGEDGTASQSVSYTEDGAIVYLYTKNDRIVWEGRGGSYFTDSIPYESRRLFYELKYLDMCRKYLGSIRPASSDEKKPAPDVHTILREGNPNLGENELLELCSRTIRETNYEQDDDLTYLCYGLFRAGKYDKVILSYLSTFYCGSTSDMKTLWRHARDYEVHTYKLGERILTQMLFSEELFAETDIFEEYYEQGAYLRLQQAYLAYVSHDYIVENRKMGRSVVEIICREYEKGVETIDICKAAVLKYYSGREYNSALRRTLKKFLQDLCEKQMYFPFFLSYEKEWLVELQLWDKTMIEYRAQKDSKVVLYYQLEKGEGEQADYSTEVLTPMYENIYVKKIVLFAGEKLRYYFKEMIDGNSYRSERAECLRTFVQGERGRYGKLNDVLLETSLEKREKMVREYACEDAVAAHMFAQS